MKKEGKTAVIAFVPVIHKGYVDFFKSHEGDIFIFGEKLIQTYVHLTRDLRTIGPVLAAKALEGIFPKRRIGIANPNDLKRWSDSRIIMPDDEVCHDIALKYFKDKEVQFIPVFLRWNKIITSREFEVSPDRIITMGEFHKKIMEKAFQNAKKSDDWWRQIAAIAVKNKKIIFESFNHHLPSSFHLMANGDPRSNFNAGERQDIYTSIHAEAKIIAKAAKGGISLEGADLYSTTFPCPNCARLIGTAGIKTVYYAKGYSLLDAEKILEHFGVKIVLVQ